MREWGVPVQVSLVWGAGGVGGAGKGWGPSSVHPWVPAAPRGAGGGSLRDGRVPPGCVTMALLCQAGAAHQGPHGDGGEALHQSAEDAAADAGEEEQVRREGELCDPCPALLPGWQSPPRGTQGCPAGSAPAPTLAWGHR